ncbi:hypothetical protein M569_10007, partial [Genlisea aurea]
PPNCVKLGRLAVWLAHGLTSAFFSSIERCSCIRIVTQEDDSIGDETDDAPLVQCDGNFNG